MANYDLNNFYEWPILIRYLMMSLLFAVVFYLGYYFDISKLSSKASSIQQDEQSLKQQIQIVYGKKVALEEELSQLPKLASILKNWQQAFISIKELPELMNQILKVGTSDQLQFSFFNPGVDEKQNIYASIPIKTVVVGNFHQIASFVSQVASMPKIVVIGNFQIVKPTNDASAPTPAMAAANGNLTATISLEVYHFEQK